MLKGLGRLTPTALRGLGREDGTNPARPQFPGKQRGHGKMCLPGQSHTFKTSGKDPATRGHHQADFWIVTMTPLIQKEECGSEQFNACLVHGHTHRPEAPFASRTCWRKGGVGQKEALSGGRRQQLVRAMGVKEGSTSGHARRGSERIRVPRWRITTLGLSPTGASPPTAPAECGSSPPRAPSSARHCHAPKRGGGGGRSQEEGKG